MTKIELKRGKTVVDITGDLFLTPSEQNNTPFRILCSDFGADVVFSKEINTQKDIDFVDEDTEIIATINVAKNLKKLDDNEKIIAYSIDITTPKDTIKAIAKKTTKPIIFKISEDTKISDIPKKYTNGIFLVCGTEAEENFINGKLVDELKKEFKVPVFVKAKTTTPEEVYSAIKKTEADAIVLGELALRQPVIFEQTKNYFEKGYYNKITRKRREKTVASFEKNWDKFGQDLDKSLLEELKNKFMTE